MKILFLSLLFGITLYCNGQNRQPVLENNSGNTLLWEISGNGLKQPSYIFGTFHLICRNDVHFSDNLRTAIRNADTMYMEMKMDDPSVMLGGMMYMTMKNGKTLKDFYSDADYQRLQKFFRDSLKLPLAMFQKMKPYFLISMFYPMMLDCSNPSGVEMELMNIFKSYKKPIKGLESLQFQASVFDSIPYEWQAKELIKNIDSTNQLRNEYAHLLHLYKQQDIDSIAILSGNDPDEQQYQDLLLTDRNKNWVKQLSDIMPRGSVFVAVGAGHLPGADGILSLLRKKGYRITPLMNPQAEQIAL